MSLNKTPRGNRLHIGIFGKRNSGKSTLINAILGHETALVSDVPGTTTDPVYKTIEIQGIGPCVIIDTAGFDDKGQLGKMRIEKTKDVLLKTDFALILCTDLDFKKELEWIESFKEKKIPYIILINKSDIIENVEEIEKEIRDRCKEKPLIISGKNKDGIEKIKKEILRKLPDDYDGIDITGDLIEEDDVVLLVMPQDIQAPKGRLILPQVQTIREILDKRCITICCTTDKFEKALFSLRKPPKLIITDSQVFKTVYEKKPKESMLTSFSILFASYKGDIDYYARSAPFIEELTDKSRILIAEACTHAPASEDIGRVKIPKMLRKKIGENLTIDIVSGNDFPKDLRKYDLIIQCGACMFNRKYMMSRIQIAKDQGVPMTNYGVVIAYLNGILDKVTY